MTKQLNREELAWAAGIMDGEGSFTAAPKTYKVRRGKRTKHHMRVTIGQASLDGIPQMLSRLQSLFAFAKLYGPRIYTNQRQAKPKYIFEVHGFNRTQAFAAAIWPWLGNVKRQQYIKAARRFFSTTGPHDWWDGPAPGSRGDWPKDARGRFVKHARN